MIYHKFQNEINIFVAAENILTTFTINANNRKELCSEIELITLTHNVSFILKPNKKYAISLLNANPTKQHFYSLIY